LDDRTIAAELDRCAVLPENRIVNPQADRGMFSSIVCAAQWKGWHRSLTHWAIVLGDQPHLHRNTLEKLIEFTARHPTSVCQPIHNTKRGHPVVLPQAVFTELAQSSAADLREFLRGRQILACECSDAGLDLDIDRREDYEKALQMSEPRARK
jgi:CTP:molybdopterin cytidylyltransferase MocA